MPPRKQDAQPTADADAQPTADAKALEAFAPLTFAQTRNAAVNLDFIDRVRVGIVKAAIAISAESDQTANHVNRVSFAVSVLRNPGSYAPIMAEGVATDVTVQEQRTDQAIYDAIAGQWNAYAGTQ